MSASIAKEAAPANKAVGPALEFEVRASNMEDTDDFKYLTFTAASDEPYVREAYFGYYREVTGFEGLDETNLKSGNMPLLDTHRNRKLTDTLGTIVDYTIKKRNGSSTILEVTARFYMGDEHSRSAYDKVKMGLIKNVSIGYTEKYPKPYEVKRYDNKEGFDIDSDIAADLRLVNWEILEISLVPVPADYTVGMGRSAEASLKKAYEAAGTASIITPKSKTPTTRSDKMTETVQEQVQEQEAAATAVAEEAVDKANAVEQIVQETEAQKEAEAQEEAEEVSEKAAEPKFTKAGAAYLAKNAVTLSEAGASKDFLRKLADKANADEGMAEAAVKAEIFDHLSTKDTKAMSNIKQGQAPAFHKADAEHNTFNFDRLAQRLAKGQGLDLVDGREGDVLKEFHNGIDYKSAPARQHATSVFVPLTAFAEDKQMRRTVEGWKTKRYDVGSSPAGYHSEVFDENWFTAALVNKATVLPYINFLPVMQYQDLKGVLEQGSIQAGFISTENATRTESTGLTFGNRDLKWKMVYARKDFSQQSLDQSRFIFGTVLNRLNRDVIRELDTEVQVGNSNTDGGFKGIFNYDSVTNVTPLSGAGSQANGFALSYAKLTEMIETVEAANANAEGSKFIMTPKIKSQLRNIQRQAGAAGSPSDIIITEQVGRPTIDGFDVITSNVPGMKAQTTGNTTSDRVIFGDLSDITGAYFSAMEVFIDPYSAAETGQTRVYVRLALDIQPNHVASFAVAQYTN